MSTQTFDSLSVKWLCHTQISLCKTIYKYLIGKWLCEILTSAGDAVPRPRGGSSLVVSQVLRKLLVTAVSDPEPHIRVAVLESLGPRFDSFLAQASCIRSLFVAVNDEVFYVREAAIHILGRLTPLNPAHVMPALRRMLVQVLTALEFGGEDKREMSSRLLQHIILASQNLIRPYVALVLAAVLPKLQDPNPNVAANVINTIGVLSKVGSAQVVLKNDEIFPLMMEAVQDQVCGVPACHQIFST